MAQIIYVRFIGISLTFKANVTVRFFLSGVRKPVDKVFGNVPKVKGEYQQLCLLTQVYALVVDKNGVCRKAFIAHEDKWKQGDAAVTFRY